VQAVTAGFQSLSFQFERAQRQASEFKEKLDSIKLPGLSEQTEVLSLRFEELAGAVTAVFSARAERTGLVAILDTVIEKAQIAASNLTGMIEGAGLPVEQRSNTALEAQVNMLRQQAADLVVRREQLREGGGFLDRLFGNNAAAEIERINQALRVFQDRAEEIQRELSERAEEGTVIGHLRPAELDKQIEALRKATLEARLQAETMNMAADAAGRYRAEQQAIAAVGGQERFQLIDPAKMEEFKQQVEEFGRWRQRLEDETKEKRAGERRESIFGSMDQEIERIRAQARALTMSAEAAARMNFEEREMLKLKQAKIAPTEEDIARIRARAEEFGKETGALKDLQRRMQEIEAYGQTFSRSLEHAFTNWLDGTKQSWTTFFNSLSKEIAAMVLRFQVLQPLFGGGGVTGGGLFGSLLKSFIPGFAEGGPISAGKPAIVGEKGPELFVPRSNGNIVPNSALRGGTSVHLSMSVDMRGAAGEETLARAMSAAAEAGARRAIEASNAGFPARQHSFHMLGS
jgi:hypothetical protein